MKRIFILYCVLFSITFNFAQSPLNSSFYVLDTLACPFNPQEEVIWPEHWRIYQTINGKWDGHVIANCINIHKEGSWTYIDLEQIDPNLPIFIRSTGYELFSADLMPNMVYAASASFELNPNISYKMGTDCPGGLCTGTIVGIDIPDEEGIGRATRMYADAVDSPTWSTIESCFTTEYFEDSFMKEFILKVTLASIDVTNQTLWLRHTGIWYDYYLMPRLLTALHIPEASYNGVSYNGLLNEFSVPPSYGPFIGLHEASYPSPDNITYIEAQLEENKPTPQEINITINSYESLFLQPFTSIRSGYVLGSDSLRHTLNIINEGGNMCITGIIDLVIEDDTHIIYKGGQLEFSGRTSCFMFHKGASLIVGAGETLQYGRGGNGALALSKGGTVELEENSHLIIGGRLVLWDFTRSPDNQVYVHLPKGTSITFDEYSSLELLGHQDGYIRLNVYMEGGVLDDSKLSESERQLINRIYPEAKPQLLDNISLAQNPVNDFLRVNYISGAEDKINLTILNLNGQIVSQRSFQALRGYNEFSFDCSQMARGLYFLKVQAGSQKGVLEWVKI